MKEIIYDVLVGALILGVMLIVIQLFRGNINLINTAAQNKSDLEQVGLNDISLTADRYSGAEVKGIYELYKSDPYVKIVLIWNNSTVTLDGSYGGFNDLLMTSDKFKIKKETATAPEVSTYTFTCE